MAWVTAASSYKVKLFRVENFLDVVYVCRWRFKGMFELVKFVVSWSGPPLSMRVVAAG